MVEIQIVSDLHLDFLKSPVKQWQQIIEPLAPYLCILGDTCELKNINLFRLFLEAISPHWKRIIIINGNHEFYGYKSRHNKEKLETKQKNVISKLHNVHLLANSHIDLDGFRFLGTTLWSHVPVHAIADVEWYVNDYRSIYTAKRTIDTRITNKWHETAVRYLSDAIKESPFPVIILTHHAPLMKGTLKPEYENSKDPDRRNSNHGFATNLERLMGDKVKLWAFGHTHWCCDFIHQGTRIYSNARGYPSDDMVYRPDYLIKVNKT